MASRQCNQRIQSTPPPPHLASFLYSQSLVQDCQLQLLDTRSPFKLPRHFLPPHVPFFPLIPFVPYRICAFTSHHTNILHSDISPCGDVALSIVPRNRDDPRGLASPLRDVRLHDPAVVVSVPVYCLSSRYYTTLGFVSDTSATPLSCISLSFILCLTNTSSLR